MSQLFQVYKSSAGSGKTFTLVKEYLKLCLTAENYFHFSSILAITFTNKATIEMKERLLNALKSISEGENEALVDLLVEETKLDKRIIREKCKLILTNILHNYGDFSISTIDRFTHRLIRTFAKDLGLPLNFQVEIDPKRILEESVERLISEVGVDPHLSNMLFAFAFYQIDESKSWRIDADLVKFAGILLNDHNTTYVEALRKCDKADFIGLRKDYQTKNKEFVKQLNLYSLKALGLIKEKSIPPAAFYYGEKGLPGYFKKNAKGFALNDVKVNTYVQKTIEEDKWYSGKATAGEKAAIDGVSSQLKVAYYEIQQLLEAELANYLGREAVIKSLYTLSLLTLIEKQMSVFKKEERLLPIADFNKRIAEVVLSEPMPFIYERIGERYNHYMIDEFQDTSELQFMNLLPLIEESLGRGNMNLIVGDAKQAIYRFRGGEMKQLAEMPNYRPQNFADNLWVSQRLQTIESQYEELALAKNWRSKDEVVKFNNAFFQFIANNEALQVEARKIFTAYEQTVKADLKQGMVDVFILDESNKELHLEQCLKDVLEAREDDYRFKDMAVLCSKNDDASLVANYLQENKVPVISSEALLIKSSPQVQFLIHLAKWIFNSEDVLAKKEILVFLSNEKQLEGSLEHHLNACIKEGAALNQYLADYGFYLDVLKLKLMPLHAFFEELIRTFDFNKNYELYLQFMQEEVFAFAQKQGNNMSEFLEWWEQKNDKLALDIPADIDAVEVLTIHKSKGLEFPVVIMPFLSSQSTKPKGHLWVKPIESNGNKLPYALVEANSELSESVYAGPYAEEQQKVHSDLLHQTYVAFTRAADRLYLRTNSISKSTKNADSIANLLMQFALEKQLPKIAEEQDRFIWGKRQSKTEINATEKQKDEPGTFNLTYHSSPWSEKLKISMESEQAWEMGENESGRSYGNLLHELLAQLAQPSEIDELLSDYLYQGKINETEAHKLSEELNEIMSNKAMEPFFKSAKARKREATLITQSGQILRPDLVVFFEDRWSIIDYKTGEKNEAHQQQVLEYVNALQQMTTLPVEAHLFYTSERELIQVV